MPECDCDEEYHTKVIDEKTDHDMKDNVSSFQKVKSKSKFSSFAYFLE